jgi:hypothetical protein
MVVVRSSCGQQGKADWRRLPEATRVLATPACSTQQLKTWHFSRCRFTHFRAFFLQRDRYTCRPSSRAPNKTNESIWL